MFFFFFFSSRRRHTRLQGDWSSDVCSSDLFFRSLRSSSPWTRHPRTLASNGIRKSPSTLPHGGLPPCLRPPPLHRSSESLPQVERQRIHDDVVRSGRQILADVVVPDRCIQRCGKVVVQGC